MRSQERMKRILVLFDVDGTLTQPRSRVLESTMAFMHDLRTRVSAIATVGGSDFEKQKEQLGNDVCSIFDFVFAENGLHAFKGNELLSQRSFREHFGEDNMQTLVNDILLYLGSIRVPVKRGTFIEFRNGMLNVSPIGRSCTQQERTEFQAWDTKSRCREQMVRLLRRKYGDKLQFSIGGQISFDVFPIGWNKTFCLQFVLSHFDEIHFFGDKTEPGGNDYELFVDPRVIGHSTKGPEDTIQQCRDLFFID